MYRFTSKRPLIAIGTLAALCAALFALTRTRTVIAPMMVTVSNSEYRTEIERPASIHTGDTALLRIRVLKADAHASIEDDRRMLHMIIASEDARDIFHTYSFERVDTGIYERSHRFTRPGTYRVWAEIGGVGQEAHHGKDADLVAYDQFDVLGTPLWNVNESAEGQRTSTGAYTTVVTPAVLKAGEPVSLRVSLLDPDGKPYRLYPEEGADFALTGPMTDFFHHGHLATTPDQVSVALPVTFPAPGVYALWVNAFPFVGESLDSVISRFLLQVQ